MHLGPTTWAHTSQLVLLSSDSHLKSRVQVRIESNLKLTIRLNDIASLMNPKQSLLYVHVFHIFFPSPGCER